MLYHVSHESGIQTLQPRVSTHKKPYVYAIENMVTGLLFGTKQDDFDFIISTDENGTPSAYECYPDSFQKIYQGKSCSVYELDETGFKRGMTSWSAELVCESEVPVKNEIVIPDLYKQLLEEEKKGTLQIHRYEYSAEYRKQISLHIVDRLIRFDVDLCTCMERDIRFATYYKGIVQALLSVTDGHLLQ